MSEANIDMAISIATVGWAVVTVAETERMPDHAHSVGLFQTFGHPEIIVVGLPPETMDEILTTLGEAIREGHQFTDGSRSSEVLEGYDVIFRSVSANALAKYFDAAIEYYGGRTFPALQCIWPDRAGRYPGEPKTRPGFSRVQPVLWRAD